MRLRQLLFTASLLCLSTFAIGQDDVSYLSGSLEARGNFFRRDSAVGTPNTPGYDHQLFGAETWLTLQYNRWGFDIGARFDLFNNSNLPQPLQSYNAQGLGRWYAKKQIKKFGIYAGYIYDQIGSGIIFRAYEARTLTIDNALYGLQLSYDFTPDWKARIFTGRQKQQLDDPFESVVKGGAIDGFFTLGDSTVASFSPGFGVVNRTFDDNTLNAIVDNIANRNNAEARLFVPDFNTYAFSLYNTLSLGKFTWYAEGAYKTDDVLTRPDENLQAELYQSDGVVLYSSLGYAARGLGITVEGKHTRDFEYRSSPFFEPTLPNVGIINFLPPMTRINSYRLTARYNAATQFLGEKAIQVDVRYSPKRKISYNINFSNITDLDNELLYREVFTEFYLKKKKWKLTAGVQFQQYNQEIYEVKPGVPLLEAVTPYVDFLYRVNKKKSIRFEAQYMNVGRDDNGELHDYGHWAFALVELGLAPHWTFTISDMYNVNPGKNTPTDENGNQDDVHFPRFDVFYTNKANRYSLSYVKQVEGIVCTGGICRLEPAFSGVRLTVNSTF